MLFNAYTEISQEVKYYCEQRGIAIVMNFNGDQMHDENPEEIARGISRQVVYYNKALDITPYIMPRFIKPVVADANGRPSTRRSTANNGSTSLLPRGTHAAAR